jgi:hypothetical protein
LVLQIQIDLEKVPIRFDRDPDSGGWLAHNDELRVVAAGRERLEAARHFYAALEALIRQEIDAGRQIPEPLAQYLTVPA